MSDDLTYSRVMSVRAAPEPSSEELLALVRQRAPDPSVLEEFRPVFFGGEISNNRWDSYQTRMGLSTLRNYAEEAAAGVAFLRNHDRLSGPCGYSLTGRFVGAGGNGVARVESDFYLLGTPDLLDYIARLRGGVGRDLSVGFHGGRYLCSLCGKDMLQWMGRDGCPHLLGMLYEEKEGQEPRMARATIEDAHLAEYSGVYDGGTPGPMIAKARSLATEGLLETRDRELVEVRYRVHLPERRCQVPGAALPERETPGEGATSMADEQERNVPPPAEAPVNWQERHSALLTRLREVDVPEAQRDTFERDPAGWVVGELTRLRPLAEDGRAYRATLIEEALAEGVRAYGNDFARETWETRFAGMDVAAIRDTRDLFARAVPEVLKEGGRRTGDGEERAEERSHKLPAAAVRV